MPSPTGLPSRSSTVALVRTTCSSLPTRSNCANLRRSGSPVAPPIRGRKARSPYIAPEMIVGKPGSGTDQYSLAITYYELRTGRLPLDAGAAFQAHVLGQLDFGLVLPAEQEVLRRATHMRPDQRYPTATEMVRALKTATGRPEAPAIAPKPQSLKDMIRAGVELVPGHTLVQLIGRGTYSEVWAATKAGKTRCAMKIVHNLDAVPGLQELKSLDMIRNLDHDRLIRLQSYWFMAATDRSSGTIASASPELRRPAPSWWPPSWPSKISCSAGRNIATKVTPAFRWRNCCRTCAKRPTPSTT